MNQKNLKLTDTAVPIFRFTGAWLIVLMICSAGWAILIGIGFGLGSMFLLARHWLASVVQLIANS